MLDATTDLQAVCNRRPPDWVKGDAVLELESMIQELMENLSCK